MEHRYVVAIDAGTSGVHCVLADMKGRLHSSCHEDWEYETPPDAAPLGREFCPDVLWQTVCRNVRRLVHSAGINPGDIAGVSATSQREGVVFLDKRGEEVYAGPNIDLRAVGEGMVIDEEHGEEVYDITGHAPSLLFVPAKLRWLQSNRPGAHDRVATALTLSDWILYRLCGEMVSEACGANELGLADVRGGQWSCRLEALLRLPSGILPEMRRPGERIGRLSAMAAVETGIPEGVAVTMAGPDTQCGLMAMGVVDAGQVGMVMGWSAPVQMVTESPLIDPQGKTWTCRHTLHERWVLESNAGEAGSAYRWLAGVMFGKQGVDDGTAYQSLERLAEQAPAGCDGALAFVGPAAMDVSNPGLKLGGLLFHVPLSAGCVQRSHLARAFLENLSFAVKANCRQMEAISGMKIRHLRIGGGLARSECLCRMLPQVLDMPVSVSGTAEVSALGAAMCAAVGAGEYYTVEEAIEGMTPQWTTSEPDALSVMEYADHFQRWCGASDWLDRASEEVQ